MNLAKVSPVSLDLGVTYRQRVATIGIELEGGWKPLPNGVSLTRDGSISIDDPDTGEYERLSRRYQDLRSVYTPTRPQRTEMDALALKLESLPRLTIGELPSPILTLDKWEQWLTQFYPQRINHTCGMHVHIGFMKGPTGHMRYQRLMVPEFPKTVVEEFIKWASVNTEWMPPHFLTDRLGGKSVYCQHTFVADGQVKKTRKDYEHHTPDNRYSVINYCWSRFQTVECRLLPMFETAEQAIRAIKHLLLITNAFLVEMRKAEEKHNRIITVDDTSYSEEKTLCV